MVGLQRTGVDGLKEEEQRLSTINKIREEQKEDREDRLVRITQAA